MQLEWLDISRCGCIADASAIAAPTMLQIWSKRAVLWIAL
jgi:hypothetical protein